MAQTRTIARPYAAAIFDLAAREQALEAWSDELALLVRLSHHETIVRLLEDPSLAGEVKAHRLLDLMQKEDKEEINASFPAGFRNFLLLLGMNKRLNTLADIAVEFERLRAQAQKRHPAVLTSAYALSEAQEKRLVAKLSQRLGGEVDLQVRVDPTLIGGAILRCGDEVIDGSLRGRLARLRESLQQRAA